jgi:hypothetical protein
LWVDEKVRVNESLQFIVKADHGLLKVLCFVTFFFIYKSRLLN